MATLIENLNAIKTEKNELKSVLTSTLSVDTSAISAFSSYHTIFEAKITDLKTRLDAFDADEAGQVQMIEDLSKLSAENAIYIKQLETLSSENAATIESLNGTISEKDKDLGDVGSLVEEILGA